MKCPYCSKENSENALFCGYCGKAIVEVEEVIDGANSMPINDEKQFSDNEGESSKERKKQLKRKSNGLKSLLVFCVIGFVTGGILGVLCAKGFISFTAFYSENTFKWISPLEGETENVEIEQEIDTEKGTETTKDMLIE